MLTRLTVTLAEWILQTGRSFIVPRLSNFNITSNWPMICYCTNLITITSKALKSWENKKSIDVLQLMFMIMLVKHANKILPQESHNNNRSEPASPITTTIIQFYPTFIHYLKQCSTHLLAVSLFLFDNYTYILCTFRQICFHPVPFCAYIQPILSGA